MTNITEQLNGHFRRNEELKKSLLAKGVDFSKPISIELHFWAFKHQDAVRPAKSLYDRGLLVLTLAPATDVEGERWNVEAGTKDTVQNLTSPAVVKQFVELAAEFDALFDGWGTMV
jgi:regulator of RNase E activity RraB